MSSAMAGDAGGQVMVAGLIGCVGDPCFGQRAIEQMTQVVPVDWWTVYRLHREAPPDLHFAGSLARYDCSAAAFHAYRDGMWRHDIAVEALRETGASGAGALSHLHAREFAPEHRRRIYDRHGLSERLTVACASGDTLLAANLYRRTGAQPFSDEECDILQHAGQLLLACVQRQLQLQASPPVAAVTAFELLTRREREVCERLLRGWTHEGVAADLEISATTVKTYRDRAFEKLGIHHRSELFALVLRH